MSLHVDPIPADRPFDAEALLAHVGWVRRLAHGLLPADPHLADDLAQQTYLTALEKRPSTDRSLSGWLATVLANLKRQERRGADRRAERERAVARAEAQTPDAGHDAKLAVHHELVQSVMSLADPYRETIVLRYFEGLSPTAIARRQHVPVATVKTRLARALDQLRAKLDRARGGDGRAWIAALVPMARPEGGFASTAMGALIVSTKLKVAVAIVIVCALITVWTVRTSRSIDADVHLADAPSLIQPDTRDSQAPEPAESIPASRSSVATSTPMAAGSQSLEVTVVDESGSAVKDTPVMLLDADGATIPTRTDERGHATFPGRSDRGTLFVKRADDAPRRVELATSMGSQRVALTPMAEVSGVLRDKGFPPAERSSLTLLSDARLFPGVDLPEEVAEFLGLDVQGKYEDKRTTAQDGSFRFTGLPGSWTGRLLLTGTWVVVESQRKIDNDARIVALAKLKDGIVLAVERVPSVIGRVLDASDNPAIGAEVRATVSWDDTNTTNFGAHTDEKGFFEVPLSTQELVHIRLEARGTGTSGSAQVTRTREELGPRLDAGVLRLVQGSSLRVHVVDRSGQPFEGAIPIVPDAIARPTDARGNSLIENVSSDAQMLRVVAKGCLAARIPLPAPGPQPIAVVLEPCNRLTLRLVRTDGTPPRNVHVDLHLVGVLFPDTDSNVVDTLPEGKFIGTSDYSTRQTRTGESMVRFGADENGVISLEGVTPGIPIGLEVRDVTDSLVTSATIAPLER